MNIYLVSRDDVWDYDEYDSFVVCAETEDDAIAVCSEHTWGHRTSPGPLTVVLVGAAADERGRGVVLGSYNAG